VTEAHAADDEPFELDGEFRSPAMLLLERAKCDIALADGVCSRLDALANGARSLAVAVGQSFIARADVVDELYPSGAQLRHG
jgi:hypothetical protein